MRFTSLVATVCSIVLLMSSTPAMAQVPEGGAIRDQRVEQTFPGLAGTISSPEVSREIQKYVGRGGTVLNDITFNYITLNKIEYTFTFGAKNGEWIGSSSFTASLTTFELK